MPTPCFRRPHPAVGAVQPQRQVRIGDRTLDGRMEVLSGVDEGTRIVAQPAPGLREDTRVRSVEREAL